MLMLSHFSHVQLFEIPWTAAHQGPPSMSMGFSRQEYQSGLPPPPPGDLPYPVIKPALTGKFFITGTTWEAPILQNSVIYKMLFF